jgi:hypothetical protein
MQMSPNISLPSQGNLSPGFLCLGEIEIVHSLFHMAYMKSFLSLNTKEYRPYGVRTNRVVKVCVYSCFSWSEVSSLLLSTRSYVLYILVSLVIHNYITQFEKQDR